MKKSSKSSENTTLLYTALHGLLLAFALLLPVLPVLGGYESVSLQSVRLFWGFSGLILAAVLLLPVQISLVGGMKLREAWRPLWRRSPVLLLLGLYLLWTCLSAFCSDASGVFLGQGRGEGLLTLLFYGLLFWLASAYGLPFARLLDLLGLVLLANGLLGALQYAGFNPLGLFPDGTDYHDAFRIYNGAFLGTLGNVDVLSAYLCLTVPLFYGDYAVNGHWKRLLPLAAGSFLLMLSRVDSGLIGLGGAVFFTIPVFWAHGAWRRRSLQALGVLLLSGGLGRSLYADFETALCLRMGILSGAMIGIGAAFLILGLILRPKSPEFSKRTANILLILMAAAMLLGLLAVYVLPVAAGPVHELHELLHGNFDPRFGSGRIRIWTAVLDLIGEKPMLGGGPDTLVHRIPFTFTRYIPELNYTVKTVADTAHNDFLNIAVNQGLPAMALYLGLLVLWLIRALRNLQRQPILAVLLAGILGYVLQSMFTFSICSVSMLFWLLLGLGDSLIEKKGSLKA